MTGNIKEKLQYMSQYHCIDGDGNVVVMTPLKFYLHKLLNKKPGIKKFIKIDLDWYLSHGYHTFDEVFKER